MKAFMCFSTLVAAACAAPQILGGHGLLRGHGLLGGHGLVAGRGLVAGHGLGIGAGQTSHVSVSKPFQGEHRSTVQSKAFGASVAAVSDHPNALHGAHAVGRGIVGHGLVGGLGHGLVGGLGHGLVGGLGHGLVGGLGHGLVGGLGHGLVGHGLGHGLGHGFVRHGLSHAVAHPVVHAAPAYHAPLVHAAPAYHAPLLAHAVAPSYHAEVYPDEVSPYTYTYSVADDYSQSNFNAAETSDGAGNAEGSYSVNLPDGRIQHVNYHADPYGGYVAEVTYDGTAAYPEAVLAHAAPAYHAPVVVAPAYHAPVVAAPIYHAPVALAHGGLLG